MGRGSEKRGQECRLRRYLEAYLWNERQAKKRAMKAPT